MLCVSNTAAANAPPPPSPPPVLSHGTVHVLNRERQFNPATGPERDLNGIAECPSGPPACSVYLDGVPVGAPYYIVLLGPVEAELYAYAVVSDPFGLSLFVLARDVRDFYARFNDDVQTWLKTNGFTELWNMPIQTNHTGCVYW